MPEVADDGLPILPFESPTHWEEWLEVNHSKADGVWIRMAKKGSGLPTVTHDQALDVALCFGWIDGKRRGHDETWFLQRFTPRAARSRWSLRNQEKVRVLAEQGRMRPPGMAEIDRAKADGRWEAAYGGRGQIEVPDDLRAALSSDPSVEEAFAGMNSGDRFAILYRLHHTKRPEMRARVIAEIVTTLSDGL